MIVLLIGIAAGVATFIGGAFALRFSNKIHMVLGFSAGAVIGVALFDLLPEALQIGTQFYSLSILTGVLGIGFLTYMLLDRSLLIFTSKDGGHSGHLGAGSLTVHSFLDGLGIGLSFQVSTTLGILVAAAVLVHDFSDGLNTVNLSLSGTGQKHAAKLWLIADALAPLLGIIATLFIRIPESHLALILALFAGFFLYIGASELLPDSHHRYPRFSTTLLTILGAALIYTAIHFAHF
jgi:zinc transporter ZupT